MTGAFALILLFAGELGPANNGTPTALATAVIPMPNDAICQREAARVGQVGLKHLISAYCVDRRY